MRKLYRILSIIYLILGLSACGSSGGEEEPANPEPETPLTVTPQVSFTLNSSIAGVDDAGVRELVNHLRLYIYDKDKKLQMVKKYVSLSELKAVELAAGSYTVVAVANVADDDNISSEAMGTALSEMSVKLVKKTGANYYSPLGDVLLGQVTLTVEKDNVTVGLPLKRTQTAATLSMTDYSGTVTDVGVLVPGVGTKLGFDEGKWVEPGVVFVPMKESGTQLSVKAKTSKSYSVVVNIAVVTEEGQTQQKVGCNIVAKDETGKVVVNQTLTLPSVSTSNAEMTISVEVKAGTEGEIGIVVKDVVVTDSDGNKKEIDPEEIEIVDMGMCPDLTPGDWEQGNNESVDVDEPEPPVKEVEIIPGGKPGEWNQGNDEEVEVK